MSADEALRAVESMEERLHGIRYDFGQLKEALAAAKSKEELRKLKDELEAAITGVLVDRALKRVMRVARNAVGELDEFTAQLAAIRDEFKGGKKAAAMSRLSGVQAKMLGEYGTLFYEDDSMAIYDELKALSIHVAENEFGEELASIASVIDEIGMDEFGGISASSSKAALEIESVSREIEVAKAEESKWERRIKSTDEEVQQLEQELIRVTKAEKAEEFKRMAMEVEKLMIEHRKLRDAARKEEEELEATLRPYQEKCDMLEERTRMEMQKLESSKKRQLDMQNNSAELRSKAQLIRDGLAKKDATIEAMVGKRKELELRREELLYAVKESKVHVERYNDFALKYTEKEKATQQEAEQQYAQLKGQLASKKEEYREAASTSIALQTELQKVRESIIPDLEYELSGSKADLAALTEQLRSEKNKRISAQHALLLQALGGN